MCYQILAFFFGGGLISMQNLFSNPYCYHCVDIEILNAHCEQLDGKQALLLIFILDFVCKL